MTKKPFQRCNHSSHGITEYRRPPATIFTFESWQWRQPRPRGYENVTPIARNDIPLVGHWCMKQLSIDNVGQSRGGYIRGVSQSRGNHLELR